MSVRVRFAPSPTGPLHIGGVRTALYNYLFAKKNNGTFILRVEDTDQKRYVKGAEDYIIEALNWAGLKIDEGPGIAGSYGPYRQSERKEIYKEYAQQLVDKGAAYYAFDTPEELTTQRELNPNFKYDSTSRDHLRNGITLTTTEIELLKESPNAVIRLKFPTSGKISFNDEIRDEVTFDCAELDDKVILKADGMPTYHLANIVDDHLMKISHVIRGEEWLSSTAHHVFMYDQLGWNRPKFAHLPLILKPTGKGKLSKRDGAKFGIPVFPLNWTGGEEVFPGFREAGFLPSAMINFLAFLGWSSKTDEEIYSLNDLIDLFTLDGIVKSGARFDIDKAKWFNQQYIIATPNEEIAKSIGQQAADLGLDLTQEKLSMIAGMMKERVGTIQEILTTGYYLTSRPVEFDEKTLSKKLKEENVPHFNQIATIISQEDHSEATTIGDKVKTYISTNELRMGEILPILRIALTGTMKGPDLFETIEFLGSKESEERILSLLDKK
jgi:glutamyl-tRNA synthetase